MSESLTEGSIRKHILRIAIPTSTGLFFNTMFNVVDTYFAGQLGTASLAGMSASFSVFFILMALTAGVGTGLAALLSNAIGRQETEKIGRLTTNGLLLAFLVGAVMTVAGVLWSPFLLVALGAKDAALAEGSRYVQCIYAGSVFFALNSAMNALLTSRGLAKPYRNFLIAGFALNVILDPLFIFGWLGMPRLGTLGVALATVIIQVFGTIYLACKVHGLLDVRLNRLPVKDFSWTYQREILAQGIPAALNMLTIAIGIFVINFFIYRFGNDASTAGYGAGMRVEQIALLPAIGLNSATLALVGQNYGARQMCRVRETFTTALRIGLLIVAIGMAIIFPLAPVLIGLFNSDPQVVQEGTRYLRIDMVAFFGYVIINICLSLLQGLKRPQYAIWIGIYRQLAMPALLFWLLGDVLNLGLTGVWWGIVATVWSGALGMLILAWREVKMRCPVNQVNGFS